MESLKAARDYLALGWMPVPVPPRSKRPVLPGWQKLRLAETELPQHFADGSNIGLLLGKTSQGLVDIDLDAPQALAAADYFLPETGRIHGRSGKPRSHRWYLVDPIIEPKKYQDIDGTCLVELRSTGQQTIVPPSIHPSGEPLTWVAEGVPARIDNKMLPRSVAKLAACALLARHWPAPGSRQDAALAVAGMLARAGWGSDEARQFIETAARVAGDEESPKRAQAVEDTLKRLASARTATGIPTLSELIGQKPTEKLIEWLELHPSLPGRDNTRLRKEYPPVGTEILLALVAGAEFFCTPEGDAYVTFEGMGHSETWPVAAKEFERWLTRLFYLSQKKPPNAQTLADTIRALEAKAQFEGVKRPVFTRIAWHDGAIYLDLANETWEVVEITPAGWHIVVDPPVRFRRTPGMQPLPRPEPGGSVHDLRPFVNVADEESFRLMLAWLVAALRPTGPYPILVLQGEQGSAKSTTTRVLRALIDPSTIPLRSLPREERDFMIAAKNAWVLAFDNLSGLSPMMSDALCRLATGGGYATRALYSNDDEVLFNVQRPAILNGIDDLVTRQDLGDRVLLLPLPPISETARRDEEGFWQEFEALRPRILGALLDVLSEALHRLPDVKLTTLPRMADFARLATAAEIALGWESGGFMAAYTGNRAEAIEVGLEANPIAQAIRGLLANDHSWSGTASELLQDLGGHAETGSLDSRIWPKTSQELGKQLRRLAPALRAIGIQYANTRTGHDRRRIITLRKVASSLVRAVRGGCETQDLQPASLDSVSTAADPVRTAIGDRANNLSANRRAKNPERTVPTDEVDRRTTRTRHTDASPKLPAGGGDQGNSFS
jgi:hypothetical protein